MRLMRGETSGGRPYHHYRREGHLFSMRERNGRELGGWKVVQSKWLKKIDIASKVKMDDVERRKLVSFFFTNFPDSLKAWDMFHLFSIHGRVMEVVIPGLKEGRRKRFGFVRFKDVKDPDLMAIKLDNVFIRGIKLHVNRPRFDREVRVEVGAKKELVERQRGTKKELGERDRGFVSVSCKKDQATPHQLQNGIKTQSEKVNKVWVKKRDNIVEGGARTSGGFRQGGTRFTGGGVG